MNPEQDAQEIFQKFSCDGIEKYRKGVKEHGGGLWTGGCGWFASQLHDELIDSASYLHHLSHRLQSISTLAQMMKEKSISLEHAAIILEELAGAHPPRTRPTKTHE